MRNEYRLVKAKRNCKQGQLVGPDDVEATPYYCGVDYGVGESYTVFYGGNSRGRTASAVQLAKTLKATVQLAKTLKATVIVPGLRTLDNLIAMGLQPSQIMVSSELQMGVSVDWVVTGCEG